MAQGGRRPGAGAKRGSSRTQKSPAEVAERRRLVRHLHYMGQRRQDILGAIQKEAPYLLDGLRSPYAVIVKDLAIIRKEDVESILNQRGMPALAAYIESQLSVMRRARSASERDTGQTAVRALQVESACADKVARAYGIPIDRPAGSRDPAALSPLYGVEESLQHVPPGIIDPLTFAIDSRFCGLSQIPERFPMQQRVLTEFMNPGNRYRILVLVCGMRSGKGVIGSVVAWYGAYQLLALGDPQTYYALTPNQEIQIVNLATSRDQARNNVFKHIKDRLDTGGEWFEALRQQAKVTGLEIHLPKNIVIRCGHSQATHQVGATSYMVILDELSKFKDTDGRDNADDVYDRMNATTATFKDASCVLCLSSPEWAGDKGMRLVEEAMEVDDDGHFLHPTMLGIQMPTWEANLNLPFEYLWEAFNGAKNPRVFWRDFGARPPEAQEGFYPDPERWDRQADPERQDPYDAEGRLADWFRPCCDSRRFAHIDLGASRDACGIAMAHKPVPGCPYHGEPSENPKARRIVLDVCVQVAPPREREAKAEISFDRIRQMIYDWQDRGFNVKGGQVSYDGWQSLDSQQQLRKQGYRVAEFSLDRDTEGHDTLQELINLDALAYYKHPVLIREAKQLSLVRGNKVDHPKGGSKDVVDAVAGACYFALKQGGRVAFVG